MRAMAEATAPQPVKLICGMISSRIELFEQAQELLAEANGPVDVFSEVYAFDFTHYYDQEMGSPLYRRFVAFERPIPPDAVVEAKIATNAMEAEFAEMCGGQPRRPINLDPGYIESSKLVLASMKNFSHRIYLGRGVYAEVTLMYHKGRWDALPWTFPDYASGRYGGFLTSARDRLRQETSG